jgi:hypothetical protein
MQHFMSAVLEGAASAGCKYVESADGSVIFIHASGDNGFLTCVGGVATGQEAIMFYSRLAEVPEHRRAAVAEYIARANDGLVIGCFTLDLYDGELACKTAMPASDAPIATEHVAELIRINLATADRHLPGLMAVIDGNVAPGDAIDQVAIYPIDGVLSDANDALDDE